MDKLKGRVRINSRPEIRLEWPTLRRYRHNLLVDFVAQFVFGDDGAFPGADFIYAALGDASEFCNLVAGQFLSVLYG